MGTNLPQEPSSDVLEWIRTNLEAIPEEGIVLSKSSGKPVGSDKTANLYYTVYCGTFNNTCIYLKRANIIWYLVKGVWPTLQLDHNDRNIKNDKLGNLTEKTNRENSYNRSQSVNRELPLGVDKHKLVNKFQAKIYYRGKQIGLGLYYTVDEAHQVRLLAEEMVEAGIPFSNIAEFRQAAKDYKSRRNNLVE